MSDIVVRARKDIPAVKKAFQDSGMEVFEFNQGDLIGFGRGRGWEGWLGERGYDHSLAECVHFDYARGGGSEQTLLMVGVPSKG